MSLPVTSPIAVLAILCGIVAFFFLIERRYKPALLKFVPPLIWIYILPVVLTQVGILPAKSAAYAAITTYGLPIFLTALLIELDLKSAFGVLRPAVLVTLFGTMGIVVGLTVGFLVVHRWLGPDAWRGYGSLAGSWIGGTGNMAAVSQAVDTPGREFGFALLADTVGFIVWLPILLVSKAYADRFARFSGAPSDSLDKALAAGESLAKKSREVEMFDLVGLLFVGFAVAALAHYLVPYLLEIPWVGKVLGKTTWYVIILTSVALPLSFTPVRKLRGNQSLALTIIYVFVASMGAKAQIVGLGKAMIFVVGALIGLVIHAGFLLLGARLFKVDVHTTAIASVANIGGAASAPIVAAYHHERLVPMAVLLALVGYAVGNYAAIGTARVCAMIGG